MKSSILTWFDVMDEDSHICPTHSFLQILFDLNEAVEHFIRKYEQTHSVNIFDYELQKENIVGTYYTAGVVRLNFTFQRGEEHFGSSMIFKIPQLGAFQDYAKFLSLYAKEKYIYETVFPLMYDGWKREKLVPEFYGSTDYGILVMDNLREFKFYQKKNGALLDVSACSVVLESMAQFHALSIKHLSSIREKLESLTVADRNNNEWEARIYPSIVNKLRKYVLPFSSNQIRDAFDWYLSKLKELAALELKTNENGFNVLLHGDLHYYNVFVKDDREKNVKECRFIDFQWSRRGSPILDVMVYLSTSIAPKDFEMHYRMLFTSYLKGLQTTLEEVDSSSTSCPYDLGEMLHDFEKYKTFFMYHVTCFVPLFWSGQFDLRSVDEVNDIDSILNSPEYCSFFNGWAKCLLPVKNGTKG